MEVLWEYSNNKKLSMCYFNMSRKHSTIEINTEKDSNHLFLCSCVYVNVLSTFSTM